MIKEMNNETKYIVYLINSMGCTDAEFEKAIGLSNGNVHNWKLSKCKPHYETMKKINKFAEQMDLLPFENFISDEFQSEEKEISTEETKEKIYMIPITKKYCITGDCKTCEQCKKSGEYFMCEAFDIGLFSNYKGDILIAKECKKLINIQDV
jgi:transcriptional regulator with XRE-family HTH domain